MQPRLPLALLALLTGCPGGEAVVDEPDLAEAGRPPAPDLRFPFVPFDINHVLCTGQSLSVGAASGAALSTTQPYQNLMFNSGVIAGGTGLTSLVPLVEGRVETMSSAMASLVTRLAREEVFAGQPPGSHDLLISCHGIGGTAYAGLKKGTTAYKNGLAQVQAGRRLSQALGKSSVVRAVTNVHGESDHLDGNQRYAEDLLAWQADYEADVQALTGQALPVPMFHSQMSSHTRYNSATSAIPGAQLAASLRRPERLILVGPKYFLEYSDGVHLTARGYRQMGEYYAKAYRQVILEGRPFSPLRPLGAKAEGAVVTVKLLVPVPPLVLDTRRVSNPGALGFEFVDEGQPAATILSVALGGPDEVLVTLSRPPQKNPRLRYAFTGKAGNGAGPQTGARGNLRDSDGTRSRNGDDLFNWCVHFELPVE